MALGFADVRLEQTIGDPAGTYMSHAGISTNMPEYSIIRRWSAKGLAALALVAAAIPMVLVAVIVWWQVGRPLLFSQTRSGLNADPFTINKFRTMSNARDAAGALLPDRLRETSVTRVLRRSRLDELPQLFAIWRGEMGFVGPRPLLPATVRQMGDLGAARCLVRPGLTGWAQVNGNTLLNDDQKLALDIWYVDHRSLGVDVMILLRTATTIARGERINWSNVAAAETHLAERRKLSSAAG